MDPKAQPIWNVVRIVQSATGFTLGLYLYIYGLFFFEKFGGDQNPLAMKWTLVIFAIGNVVILLLDIPTGALADYLGRKRTVIWSFFFRGIFFFLMALMCFTTQREWSFVIAAFAYGIFGVGYALFSGALLAWVVDCLREEKVEGGHGPIITKAYVYLFNSQLIGALLSFYLYTQKLIFFAFAIGFVTCALCVVYCMLFMKETASLSFHKGSFSLSACTKEGCDRIRIAGRVFINYPVIFYLSLLFALFLFLNHVVTFLWPVYMKVNFGFGKMSFFWLVLIILSIALGTVGSKILSNLTLKDQKRESGYRNVKLRQYLVRSCWGVSLSVFLLGISSVIGFASIILLVVTVGVVKWGLGFIRPCYETLVNNYIRAEDSQSRATVLSVGSMMTSLLTIFLILPSGGKSGLNTVQGWLLPAVLLLAIVIIAHWRIRRYQIKVGELKVQEVKRETPVLAE